ncbi:MULTISPECIES: HAD family hydrolase [unclassified Psychrobacter]|uniref:HAD family hydrolase n=1 Tax=unclassified Psychrobacter TaxID=196806 RepID=UPI00071E7BC6|nr:MULTISPECIES: HAD family hydrolase [unclassified Psychrobacter]OLF36783.1 HAD family hydrolase [Psychrobacter sp. Cmf 22.2]
MSTDINSIKEQFNHIKLCVFDMAGTTVNEDNLVYKTVRDAINQALIDEDKADKAVDLDICLAFGAGKEKRQAITDILNELDIAGDEVESLTDTAFTIFKTRLAKAYTAETLASFEGMLELFNKLKETGRKVVLNTGYDATTANNILTILGWSVGNEIDALITADDVRHGRPAPDMITLAMENFGIKDSMQVLKAGDSGIDIEEGKNANCGLCIGVLSGAQTRAQLEQHAPDMVLRRLTDLAELI